MTETIQPYSVNVFPTESKERPVKEVIKTKTKKIAKYFSFTGTFVSATLTILEKLNILSVWTGNNFIIIPILTVLSFIVYFVIPETVSLIREKIDNMKNKKHASEYELSEINMMINSLKDTHQSLSQCNNINPYANRLNFVRENIDEVMMNEPVHDNTSDNTSIYKDDDGHIVKIVKVT